MKKSDKIKNSNLFVTGAVTASLLAGCARETSEIKEWREAPGTNGFINLADVVKAFQNNQNAEEFEKRVNEIYEGDHLVVFKSEQKGKEGFVYHAYEDLNKDAKANETDDLLFTLMVADSQATLMGGGVNQYYKFSWAYKPAEEKKEESYYSSRYHTPYYHYWYYGRGWRGYYTPRNRYDSNADHRKKYRGSSGFVDQVKKNAAFAKSSSTQYGSAFVKSAGAQSVARKNYISKASSSDGFAERVKNTKNASGWGVRSNNSVPSAYSTAAIAAGGVVAAKAASRSSRGGSFSRSRGSSGFGV